MALVAVTKSDDGTTKVVEYRQGSASGVLVCVSTEPSAAVAAADAAKQATHDAQIGVLRQLLDSGQGNPTQANVNKAVAFAALVALVGRDAAIAAIK